MQNYSFSIKTSLSYAWNKISVQSVMALGVVPFIFTALLWAFIISLVFGTDIATIITVVKAGEKVNMFVVNNKIAFGALALVGILFSTFISVGRVKIVKKIIDDEVFSWKDVFTSNLKEMFFALFLMLVNVLIVMVGLVCLIVPGVILLTILSISLYILIDKKYTPLEAIEHAFYITKNERFHLFAFLVFYSVLTLVFVNAGSLLGSMFISPFVTIAGFYIYRKLDAHYHHVESNNHTAIELRPEELKAN